MSDEKQTTAVTAAEKEFARLREDFLDSWDEELELRWVRPCRGASG